LTARGSFFCVGDVKQAIYGWRGGSAEIFKALNTEFTQLEEKFSDQSYRSSPPIIDVVNRVFENLPNNPALKNLHRRRARLDGRFQAAHDGPAGIEGLNCRLETAPADEVRSQKRRHLGTRSQTRKAAGRRSAGTFRWLAGPQQLGSGFDDYGTSQIGRCRPAKKGQSAHRLPGRDRCVVIAEARRPSGRHDLSIHVAQSAVGPVVGLKNARRRRGSAAVVG